MANASHQSKQKQQTSKKELPPHLESKTNGQTDSSLEVSASGSGSGEAVYLSRGQADLFKQLLEDSQKAQNQVQFALIAAGIQDQAVTGGDLDAEKPYFLVDSQPKAVIE